MYTITWKTEPKYTGYDVAGYRKSAKPSVTIVGITRHATRQLAEKQVAIWQRLFRNNTYTIIQL